MRLVVTGGAGFIGSNFLRYMLKKYPNYEFVNIDKLTYSSSLSTIKEFDSYNNYSFIKEDICNSYVMESIIKKGDVIINFAAESHVDNSIKEPGIFVKTNVLGTQTLLESARKKNAKLFVQISTDEVYGSSQDISFNENSILSPSSPYSASKAAADMICIGNLKTFSQSIIITRSANNYGPYHFPEKVIPLFITNLLRGKKVPLYGEGKNIREWLFVEDNCSAIDTAVHKGKIGEIYNVSSN